MSEDRIQGALLAGAVGDALGAPLEFLSLTALRRRFGPQGLRDYAPAYGGPGRITDDTQMTLFTAEGLLDAVRAGASDPLPWVHRAYRRWLRTQEGPHFSGEDPGAPSPWERATTVNALRGPGATCLEALRCGRAGTWGNPLNDSKGCGGLMRVGPVGLVCRDPAQAFEGGVATAALTHGHPTGALASGVQAALVSALVEGAALEEALDLALALLRPWPGAAETENAVQAARACARRPSCSGLPPCLGQGWIAEETLAIAVYALLVTPTLEEALLIAVNHGGDSDSTGAVAGTLAGARDGQGAIPGRWLEALEAQDVIADIAGQLALLRTGGGAEAFSFFAQQGAAAP